MTETKEIRFWGKGSKYFEFTNFYIRPVKIDNEIWLTTEHYYQASKFINHSEIMQEIKGIKLARDVYTLANIKYKSKVRPDWNDVKVNVMRKAVYEKFSQNNDLKKLLLSTGDAILIENSPYDSFWGVGSFGGKYIVDQNNWLGKILMEVREKLK